MAPPLLLPLQQRLDLPDLPDLPKLQALDLPPIPTSFTTLPEIQTPEFVEVRCVDEDLL